MPIKERKHGSGIWALASPVFIHGIALMMRNVPRGTPGRAVLKRYLPVRPKTSSRSSGRVCK